MYKLGNLTIIFPSYNCDRNCPFCIAKNNRKFNSNKKMNFSKLAEKLEQFKHNDIRFERFVLSGNGEPSLYSLEELKEVAKVIKDYEELFDTLRIHTSGNIFFEREKFYLFNDLISDVEFDILRLVVDSEKDMQLLGYDKDYMQTENLKKAKRIKFDIGLTKELDKDLLPQELENFLQSNPNIEVIRFKNLMSGENEISQQAQWVIENRLSKNEFMELANNLVCYFDCKSLEGLTSTTGKRILFENSGNYPKDVVFSNDQIIDYSEQPISIDNIKKMATIVDKTKPLIYYDDNR